jgi:hypothetical protein
MWGVRFIRNADAYVFVLRGTASQNVDVTYRIDISTISFQPGILAPSAMSNGQVKLGTKGFMKGVVMDENKGAVMDGGISRRNFLKDAVLIAGGATLAVGGLSGCASGEQETTGTTTPTNTVVDTTSTGHFRPAPNSGMCPSPLQSGYSGPDAQPILPVSAPTSWDEEFDVVVVGSGFGGLSAAVVGATNGASVTLIEKGDVTGGASRHAAGNLIVTGGSKAQEAMGYHWPGTTYDPMAGAAKYQDYCDWTIDDKLLLATIEGGKDWADWMTDLPGIDWVCNGPAFIDRPVAEKQQNTVLGNDRITNTLTENAENAGVAIKLLTECIALVQEGDRIVGIKVSDVNGDETFIKANKAVLLTAGGFGVTLDLLEQYIPTAYMYAAQGGPFASHTGDCFRMGLGVGADVSGFNSFSCWEGGLDEYWGNGDGEYFHYFWHAEKQVAQNPWLKIDKNGNRLEFFAPGAPDGVVQKNWTMESISVGDLTNAARWSSSIGHRSYNILDSNFRDSLDIFGPTADGDLDPHRYPLTDNGKTVENSFVSTDWESEWEAAIQRGAISKADTIEELAGMLGLNVDKVVKAVDHWNNEICVQGEDTELPVPYKPEWLIPVTTPPYYGFALGGQISKTMCGLRINENMQVITPEGDIIPGLYAGWYTAGGIGGENNYGGQFGNPTLHGGVAISGVGGYMAINAILAQE